MSKTQIDEFTLRTARIVLKRKGDLTGSKGKFCIAAAKQIVDGTISKKDLKEFERYDDFISMCLM